jgi:excisionase family DNA binding protein
MQKNAYETSGSSPTTQSPWLTATDAAAYLAVKPQTLLMWARSGMVKGYTLSGTHRHVWRFRTEDLDAAFRGNQ